jgi:hypothetical protein
MKNKIEDLRNHLFATLEALQDKDNPMELERARAIAKVAQVVVDSARVECDAMKITGARDSQFIPAPAGTPDRPRLVRGA